MLFVAWLRKSYLPGSKSMDADVIILAGGLGTRLREKVPNLPKPMADIGGKPFLELLLNIMRCNGFRRVILSVGYKAEEIIDYFGSGYKGLELVYEREKKPLGTGGALLKAVKSCVADHAFVFNGDTYLDLEISGIETLWQGNKNPIIVGRYVNDTSRYGRLKINKGKVEQFLGKGIEGAGVINAGCYVLPGNIFDGGDYPPFFSFEKDFLAPMIKSRTFDLFITKGQFIDIGVPEDYEIAQSELSKVIYNTLDLEF